MQYGIATVYQDPEMIPSFTGYENIFLGFESEKKGALATINRRELRERAEDILKEFPVYVDLTKPVAELEAVDQEIVAVLRALSHQSGMSVLIWMSRRPFLRKRKKEVLFRLINHLKNRDISIIYITHRLEEVYQIADKLTIFRDGGTWPP